MASAVEFKRVASCLKYRGTVADPPLTQPLFATSASCHSTVWLTRIVALLFRLQVAGGAVAHNLRGAFHPIGPRPFAKDRDCAGLSLSSSTPVAPLSVAL